MSSRRKLRAARRLILPAVLFVAAGSAPPLHAQSEPAAEPALMPETAPVTEVAPVTTPDSAAPAPAPVVAPASQSGAVFDAPGMPGVPMMAPRPDTPAPAVETIVPGAQQTVLPVSPEAPAAVVPA